jgi:hypothetical protein
MVTPLMEPTIGIGRRKEHDSHLLVESSCTVNIYGSEVVDHVFG